MPSDYITHTQMPVHLRECVLAVVLARTSIKLEIPRTHTHTGICISDDDDVIDVLLIYIYRYTYRYVYFFLSRAVVR